MKTSMSHLAKSLEYIKCHSLRTTRPFNNPSISIRYNCQKVCSSLRRPVTKVKFRKAAYPEVINRPIIYNFSKILLITERRLTMW